MALKRRNRLTGRLFALRMAKVNMRHRASIERIDPSEAFANDAAQNAATTGQFVRGVRILSRPDAAGLFDLEPGIRHVGETAGAVFLAPERRGGASGDTDRRADYEGFLDEIITAARRFGFDPAQASGRDDPRLRGLRQ